MYMTSEDAFRKMTAIPGRTSGSWAPLHPMRCGHDSQGLPLATGCTGSQWVTSEQYSGAVLLSLETPGSLTFQPGSSWDWDTVFFLC